MPRKLTEKDVFDYKRVTPSTLQQDNFVSFKYKSPNGVHDPQPLVYVVEKQLDRFYGFNVHYDNVEYQDLVNNVTKKVNKFLQEQWLRKYPENKKKLKESKIPFNKSMIDKKDLKEFSNRINRKDVEQFLLKRRNEDTLRCYLFVRMNQVQKLTWKIV